MRLYLNKDGLLYYPDKKNVDYKGFILENAGGLGISLEEEDFIEELTLEEIERLLLIRDIIKIIIDDVGYTIELFYFDGNKKDLIFNISLFIVGGVDNPDDKEAKSPIVIKDLSTGIERKFIVEEIYSTSKLYELY